MRGKSGYDVVVIGAGAAGMMCAAQAGQRGRSVLLIEHYPHLGEKIRISGGGRCNFTNTGAGPANYLSSNPDYCRSALARYTPRHFISLVERYGIAYHEKKLGQLFCDDTAQDIIRMLKAECDAGRVQWRMPCAVDGVDRRNDGYLLATPQGPVQCESLVIATGGLSVPNIGATPFGYRVAEQFGLAVVPPRPGLVPLAFAPEALARYGDLSGMSVDAEISCNGGRFRENLLFTHRGLSGPAILQVSSYWDGRTPLSIDLLPGVDAARWLCTLAASPTILPNVLAQKLPRRFAQQWCAAQGVALPLKLLGEARLRDVAAQLHDWRILPSGTLGYQKAEVTCGGVDTAGLSSKTMAATAVAGLYFIGEVVDVTGWLGGYNFQWAWASGHAAGQVV
ncbi:MAG TPA: NAD(P)/FAD-dependent oxidoreductase [Casimicrobiaceae bacterium]|nr:NAD(P)/FAD-dependent oxidoreductase [Casimicrobiaceae bacterium]